MGHILLRVLWVGGSSWSVGGADLCSYIDEQRFISILFPKYRYSFPTNPSLSTLYSPSLSSSYQCVDWSVSPAISLFNPSPVSLRSHYLHFIVCGNIRKAGDDEWSCFGPDCYLELIGCIYLPYSSVWMCVGGYFFSVWGRRHMWDMNRTWIVCSWRQTVPDMSCVLLHLQFLEQATNFSPVPQVLRSRRPKCINHLLILWRRSLLFQMHHSVFIFIA